MRPPHTAPAHCDAPAEPKRNPRPLWAVLCQWVGVICVILSLTPVAIRMAFRIPTHAYYEASEAAFVVPELMADFVPGGLTYHAPDDLIWISGHRIGNRQVPLFAVRRQDGTTAVSVTLSGPDGTPLSSQGAIGGVAVHGNQVYVACGELGLLVYAYDHIQTAAEGAVIPCAGALAVSATGELTSEGSGAPIVTMVDASETDLLIGGYTYPQKGSSKQEFTAWTYRFSHESDALCGLSPLPTQQYLLPDTVRSVHRASERAELYVACAYGMAPSRVFAYPLDAASFSTSDSQCATIHLTTVPDENTESGADAWTTIAPKSVRSIPPLVKGLTGTGDEGALYVLYESASLQYLFGRCTSSHWCYATPYGYWHAES